MSSLSNTPVTRTLLWINVGIHIFVLFFIFDSKNIAPYIEFLQTFGLIPSEFWTGAFWQPITSMFLHSPIMIFHILVNMLSLWSLGIPIERTIGSSRFAYLYMVSGAMGSLFVVLFQPGLTQPTIGASGAVFGVLGALAVFYPRSVLLIFFIPMKARNAAIVFGSLSLLAAIWVEGGVISHLGHLGGLVGGVLYSRFVLNLRLGKHDLGTASDGFGAQQRHPYRGPEPDDSRSAGAQVFDMLFGNRSSKEKKSTTPRIEVIGPTGRVEKIINPSDDELRKADQNEEERPNAGKQGQKLYYDPVTGRFIIK